MKKIKGIAKKICPMCRGKNFTTFPNKQIDREVKRLHVYCTNKGRGCAWQGEINNINNHITKDGGCEYEDVQCTSGCGRKMQRKDLTKHKAECPSRRVNCQYCQHRGEHKFIEGKHKEMCIEYPLVCPNKCGRIPRKDMDKHRSKCPLEVINCEYQPMGYEVRMTRQTQKEHNKKEMEYHLHLTKCKLIETNYELTRTKAKLNDKLDETVQELSQTTMDLKAQFIDRISSFETLLLQLQWSSQLYSATEAGNEVIPVTFKVTSFSMKVKSLECWQSAPFYTNTKGYRMCLRVDAGGNGIHKSTHCSIFFISYARSV